jgi:hypothetical protein
MRDELRRKVGELWRTPREGDYPGGDYHPLRTEGLTVVDLDPESIGVRRDMHHATLLEARDRALLEPASVIDEALERHRFCPHVAGRHLVVSEAERVIRVGDMGGVPSRAEQHPARHVMRPALHRLPEGAHAHPRLDQVRRGRESVRACPNDDDRVARLVVSRAGTRRRGALRVGP